MEQKIKGYKKLVVWQKSIQLAVDVYGVVQSFPKSEMYVLSDQMRRAAVSIPSNIAEGYERQSTAEYIRFLTIARGSKAELETQLMICEKLNFGDKEKIKALGLLCSEIGKMLNSTMNTLASRT